MRPTRAIGVYRRPPRGLGGSTVPRINNRVIPCPDCGAEVDAPCVSVAGTPRKAAHPTRKRLANRAALAARQKEAS